MHCFLRVTNRVTKILVSRTPKRNIWFLIVNFCCKVFVQQSEKYFMDFCFHVVFFYIWLVSSLFTILDTVFRKSWGKKFHTLYYRMRWNRAKRLILIKHDVMNKKSVVPFSGASKKRLHFFTQWLCTALLWTMISSQRVRRSFLLFIRFVIVGVNI